MNAIKHWSRKERPLKPSSVVAAPSRRPRIVAMTLAEDLADAVKADPEDRQELVDAALCVAQWLVDRGIPGRWDRLRPAEVLRSLDFQPALERERVLFSLVGLLGHAAFLGQLAPSTAKQAIDEVATLTKEAVIRVFAQTASAQVQGMTA